MTISLHPITSAQQSLLDQLFQLYIYELSATVPFSLNDEGRYISDSSNTQKYWQDPDHTPYIIRFNHEIAGFALVRRYPPEPTRFDMEQFFVVRKFQGQKIGMRAAHEIFQRHPGPWQIRVLQENTRAQHFWQTVVTNEVDQQYTRNNALDIDLVMTFYYFEIMKFRPELASLTQL